MNTWRTITKIIDPPAEGGHGEYAGEGRIGASHDQRIDPEVYLVGSLRYDDNYNDDPAKLPGPHRKADPGSLYIDEYGWAWRANGKGGWDRAPAHDDRDAGPLRADKAGGDPNAKPPRDGYPSDAPAYNKTLRGAPAHPNARPVTASAGTYQSIVDRGHAADRIQRRQAEVDRAVAEEKRANEPYDILKGTGITPKRYDAP